MSDAKRVIALLEETARTYTANTRIDDMEATEKDREAKALQEIQSTLELLRATTFDQKFTCGKCRAPVRIIVSWPASAVLVVEHWRKALGGLCADCIIKSSVSSGARPLGDGKEPR